MSDEEVVTYKRRHDSDDDRKYKKMRDSDRLGGKDRKKSSKSDRHDYEKSEKRREDKDRYDDRKRKYDDRRQDDHYENKKDRRYDGRRRDDYSRKESRKPYNNSYVDLDYPSYYEGKQVAPPRSPSYEPEVKFPRYYGSDEDRAKTDKKSSEKRDRDDKNNSKQPETSESQTDGNQNKEIMTRREKKTVDLLTSKTGGAYIPPAKLRMMQAEITDKSSAAYQRIAWEALKKSIHGFINKINVSNIAPITKELLRENIVRGRGLLCKSIIQAQSASPTFTHVYAALAALINVKFPNIGELLLKRLVLTFKRSFKRNDKANCIAAANFVAHLINQRVAHEILALEILTLLVESPTDDSVEVAIAFLKECGQKLTEVSPKGINAIFEMLRNILHEGQLEKRIQYMIEVIFQVRKDGFKDHAAIIEELDLVEEDDQFTHLITLDDVTNGEDILSKSFNVLYKASTAIEIFLSFDVLLSSVRFGLVN